MRKIVAVVAMTAMLFSVDTASAARKTSKIVDVSAGADFSIARDEAFNMYVSGNNSLGQIGGGIDASLYNFTITFKPKCIDVSAGENHSLAIDTSNELWVTGYNDKGQLGTGDFETRRTWTRLTVYKYVRIGKKIVPVKVYFKDVEAGNSFSLAISTDNEMWVWGAASEGQLALGSARNDPLNPIYWGKPGCVYKPSLHGMYFDTLVSGDSHTLARNGTLYGWGCNNHNELTKNNPKEILDRVVPVPDATAFDAGYHKSIRVYDGDVYFHGKNDYSCAGTGEDVEVLESIVRPFDQYDSAACGKDTTYLISKAGLVWSAGNGELCCNGNRDKHNLPVQTQIALDCRVKAVSCREGHVMLLDTEGNVLVLGDGFVGQLGIEGVLFSDIPQCALIAEKKSRDEDTVQKPAEQETVIFSSKGVQYSGTTSALTVKKVTAKNACISQSVSRSGVKYNVTEIVNRSVSKNIKRLTLSFSKVPKIESNAFRNMKAGSIIFCNTKKLKKAVSKTNLCKDVKVTVKK